MSESKKSLLLIFIFSPILDISELVDYQDYNEIILASKKILIEKNDINWEKEYPDPEDTMALHRFSWLLTSLLKQKSKKTALKLQNHCI